MRGAAAAVQRQAGRAAAAEVMAHGAGAVWSISRDGSLSVIKMAADRNQKWYIPEKIYNSLC